MKNRHDDKKYILRQYQKNDLLRLYRKIDEISNRKMEKSSLVKLNKTTIDSTSLIKIPKTQN